MESKHRGPHSMAFQKTKLPSYFLLLLVAAAFLGFQGLQKFSERNLSHDTIAQKDARIEQLQNQLQRERKVLQDTQVKLEGLYKQANTLRSDKVKLIKHMTEIEMVKNAIEEKHMRLQTSLQLKEEQINKLKQQERKVMENKAELQALTDLIERKDEEIKQMKSQLISLEGVLKGKNNGTAVSNMEASVIEMPNVLNNTGSLTHEEEDQLKHGNEKLNTSKDNMHNDFLEMKVMEKSEKDVLGSKLSTINDHASDLETDTDIQTDEDVGDEKSSDSELELGDNFDDVKEEEDLETNLEDADTEDLQGEESDILDDVRGTER